MQKQPSVSPAWSLHDFSDSKHLNRTVFGKNKCTYCQQWNSWITLSGLYHGQTRWQPYLPFPNSLAVAGRYICLKEHHLNFLARLDLFMQPKIWWTSKNNSSLNSKLCDFVFAKATSGRVLRLATSQKKK